MVEQVNVKGKVVVPTPELIIAMAQHSLSVNDSELRKALYSVAFTTLVSDLQSALTTDSNSFKSWEQINPYMGYAILDTFETYHIVECYKSVDFTLGDKSNWSRPFDFGAYCGQSDDKVINGLNQGIYRSKANFINYEDFYVPKNTDEGSSLKMIVNKVHAKNIKTTNAFIRKFGVAIKNPYLQSWLDTGVNVLDQFDNFKKQLISVIAGQLACHYKLQDLIYVGVYISRQN